MGAREELIDLMRRAEKIDDQHGLVSFSLPYVEQAVSVNMDVDRNSDAITMGSDFAVDALGAGMILPMPYPTCLFTGRMVGNGGADGRKSLLCHASTDKMLWARKVYASGDNVAFSPMFTLVILDGGRSRWQVLTWPGADIEESDRAGESIGALALACLGVIAMRQVKITDEPPPERLNNVREKKGLGPIGRVVTIRLNATARSAKGDGTHASPRPHWRRGHLRRIEGGRIVKVAPHAVMGNAPLPSILVKE